MKPFAHYLAESERTYNYRIKMLGKPSGDLISQLKKKLDQFDPVKIGEPKTTPIQIIPTDFPNNKNDSVTMFDVSFRYPAIEPQIKQLAQLMGFDPNHIIMLGGSFRVVEASVCVFFNHWPQILIKHLRLWVLRAPRACAIILAAVN
jgi:hypothetical protein